MSAHISVCMCGWVGMGGYARSLYIVSFAFIPVLNELCNRRQILTAEECSEVAKPTLVHARKDKLVLFLSGKPESAVKEATEVMKLYHFNTQRLHGELPCKFVTKSNYNRSMHYQSHVSL